MPGGPRRRRRGARLRAVLRLLVPRRPKALRDSLTRWLFFGVIIGLIAGAGAIVFYWCLGHATGWLLVGVGGYQPPTTVGEGGGLPGGGFTRPWAIPLVTCGGALAAGLLVAAVAPEAKGHGTDAAILAVHHEPASLRGRVAAVKVVASSLVIGSGGSGGREGPTAQISATVVSMICGRARVPRPDARIAVSAGMAAGIGAIFRAPLGGALLGAELLYRDDLEADAIMPSLVSSITAYAVFGAVYGFHPIFGTMSSITFSHPGALVWFAALGAAAGVAGRAYAGLFHGGGALLRRIPVPAGVLPGLGGLAVGLLGLVVPAALGTGYGWVQLEMDADWVMAAPLWLILAIPPAKIVSTTLSIGSGGSGGVFGPGMVIGGCAGAAVWRLLAGLPWVSASPAPYVIVGMIACFGSIAHAPLGVMLMVAEMTGNLSLLAPAMIAVAVATLVAGDRSIYVNQLEDRLEARALYAEQAGAVDRAPRG
ncbi:chloride channel protein [uncultured Propionibacterium sp.]|uniref:chloride channel protein n=1 Tax=uncultured Propionibacterium sp. TaxID=218066 RepID=UPI00292F89FF|nr:chloride channel protein [uncultured Propionibacterium sp.]